MTDGSACSKPTSLRPFDDRVCVAQPPVQEPVTHPLLRIAVHASRVSSSLTRNFYEIWCCDTHLGQHKFHRDFFARWPPEFRGRGTSEAVAHAAQLNASAEGAKGAQEGRLVMCRSSRLGRWASLRPQDERQNGEAEAGDLMPHTIAVHGNSKSGPSRPYSGCSSWVICRSRSASWRASKPRSIGPIIGGFYALASEGSTPRASRCYCPSPRRLHKTTIAMAAGMTAYSVIVWGASRDAHVPSETLS
jgi:hypothetical protein